MRRMGEARAISDWEGVPFECAPGLRLQAHERLSEVRLEALTRRVDKLEEMVERLERRLWVTVYGVVSVILAQAFQSVLLP